MEERTCAMCNTKAIEDEYHFIFHCDFYKDERAIFYRDIGTDLETKQDNSKLLYIFNNNCRMLGKFVSTIFQN